MIERKEIPLGMQVFTGDPALIEVLGLTGFDFVMLDTEHSGNSPGGPHPDGGTGGSCAPGAGARPHQ
jgi:hypothetical protein